MDFCGPLEMRTHPLPPPNSDCVMQHARREVVVIQPTVVSSFGCFVFEIWVLHFRVLGASCFGLRFRVPLFQNYRLKIGFNCRPPRVANPHKSCLPSFAHFENHPQYPAG